MRDHPDLQDSEAFDAALLERDQTLAASEESSTL